MALVAYWLENFMEWPDAAAVGLYAGTGWSGTVGPPTVRNNSNFASGKALRYTDTNVSSGDYAFPSSITSGNLSFNNIRTFDSVALPTEDNSSGYMITFGVANTYIRMVPGSSGLGLQNTWFLQVKTPLVGFRTIAQTTNNVLLGTKHSFGFSYDAASGGLSWYVDGVLLFFGVIGELSGLGMVGIRVGRMGSGTSSGIVETGDFYLYGGVPFAGIREIRGGFPTGNDTLQDWAFVGGASAWESVNNDFSLAATQYIEGSAAGQISDFTCPISQTGVVRVDCVSIETYAVRTDVSATDVNSRYGQGASFSNGATYNPLQASYQKFRTVFTTNPISGVGFVPSDLPAIKDGVRRST